LDVEMPHLNGFDTCARLRTNMALRNTPIVFLTARQTAEDVQRCIAVGGNDFVIKPFDVEKLAARVDFWTNRRLQA
jgi:DNA-binding response OmpR family regulator